MLNTKNLHSDLKATFTYPLTGYNSSLWQTKPAAFGRKTLRSLLQTGHRTLQHSYGNKKKIISDDKNCYEIYGDYTELQFFTKPIKTGL
jgi:uncharacterized protein (DUF2237 family)